MRYAVIGTGWIAGSYISGASMTGVWELGGVYSRSLEKGLAFIQQYGGGKVYTSLDDLASDASIEAVYIASPNVLHYRQSKAMLVSGKHVLCEKPITVLPEECKELQEIARERKLVYLEAIMMLHLPQREILKNELSSLGKVTSASFNFFQLSSKYPAFLRGELPNIFNPRMAAGSLMDLGVYCVYPALDLFGMPMRIFAKASFLPTGADGSCVAVLEYEDKLVTLSCSKTGQSRQGSEILGEQGSLLIRSISQLTGMSFFDNSGGERLLAGPAEKEVLMSGEARDFYRYITSPLESGAEYLDAGRLALEVSGVMKEIRDQAGISFLLEEGGNQ